MKRRGYTMSEAARAQRVAAASGGERMELKSVKIPAELLERIKGVAVAEGVAIWRAIDGRF